MFKFTDEMSTFLSVDIREGGKSLRGIRKKTSAPSRPVDGLRNAAWKSVGAWIILLNPLQIFLTNL